MRKGSLFPTIYHNLLQLVASNYAQLKTNAGKVMKYFCKYSTLTSKMSLKMDT